MLSLEKLKGRVQYYRNIAEDARTPYLSKILILAAVGYLISPIDLIPDFIPLLGHMDDLIIVPVLIWAALMLVPSKVKADALAKSETIH